MNIPNKRHKCNLVIDDKQLAILDALVDTRLFGSNRSEVIRFAFLALVREALASGNLPPLLLISDSADGS